jgi:glycosyltransferase involved in cell wall biosynthesis
MLSDVQTILSSEDVLPEVLYLPDYYPVEMLEIRPRDKKEIVIGCYGAIRPLKNQLIQAVAAIKFADDTGKKLKFHVNGSDVDSDGQPILQNLRALFAGTRHELIEDKWMTHKEFLESLKVIDIGMQVSFTETFCIVAADLVSSSVPTVVSHEVVWASNTAKVSPTHGGDMAQKLKEVWALRDFIARQNHSGLEKFVENSKRIWLDFAGS